MSEQYTYAVARIRALEVSLFSDSTIDQLIACQSYTGIAVPGGERLGRY